MVWLNLLLNGLYAEIMLILRGSSSLWRPESKYNSPIGGRVDRAYATEAVDPGSIPGLVKPKTRKIGVCNFPA